MKALFKVAFKEQRNLCKNREAQQDQNFILVSAIFKEINSFTRVTSSSSLIKLNVHIETRCCWLLCIPQSPKARLEREREHGQRQVKHLALPPRPKIKPTRERSRADNRGIRPDSILFGPQDSAPRSCPAEAACARPGAGDPSPAPRPRQPAASLHRSAQPRQAASDALEAGRPACLPVAPPGLLQSSGVFSSLPPGHIRSAFQLVISETDLKAGATPTPRRQRQNLKQYLKPGSRELSQLFRCPHLKRTSQKSVSSTGAEAPFRPATSQSFTRASTAGAPAARTKASAARPQHPGRRGRGPPSPQAGGGGVGGGGRRLPPPPPALALFGESN